MTNTVATNNFFNPKHLATALILKLLLTEKTNYIHDSGVNLLYFKIEFFNNFWYNFYHVK